MKKPILPRKYHYFTILIIYLFPLDLYSQWNNVTSPTTQQLQSISFATSNVGYAGGADGTFKTIDGGTSWNKIQYSGVDSLWLEGFNIQHLWVVDASTVYIAGWNAWADAEAIIKTVNGGTTWTKQLTGPAGSILNGIFLTSPTTGCVVGNNGRILRTTNGTSWSAVTSGTTDHLMAVYFPSASIGYAVGENVILKTVNGGLNWTKTISTSSFSSLYFTNNLTGYAGTLYGKVLKTIDGGASWQPYETGDVFPLRQIKFVNDSTGYIASSFYGGKGTIFKTTSFGKYWEPQPSANGDGLYSVFFSDENNGFSVGEAGKIIRTSNAGGLTAPIASFNIPTGVCADSIIQFKNNGPTGYVYEWKDNGISFGTTHTVTRTFVEKTTHTISLIVTNNGFSDTSDVTFTVAPSLAIDSLITSVSNDSICANSYTTILVSNSEVGVEYSLRKGNTVVGTSKNGTGGTLTFNTDNPSTKTTYNIKAVKTNACGTNQIISYDTVYVFAYPSKTLSVAAVRTLVCPSDTTHIRINNTQIGVMYQLIDYYNTNNPIGSPVPGTGSTIYLPTSLLTSDMTFSVKATNVIGCKSQLNQNVLVRIQVMSVNFQPSPSNIFVNDTIQVSNTSTANVNTFNWDFGANSTPSTGTGSNPGKISYSTIGTSTITLIASTTLGCTDTVYKTINVFNPAASNGTYCDAKTIYTYSSNHPYFDNILDVHNDRFGNTIVAGFYYDFQRWPNPINLYINTYDKYSNLKWSNIEQPYIPGSGYWNYYYSNFANAVASDDYGNIFIAGSYAAPEITFGNIHTSTIVNSTPKAFITKFDSTGVPTWIIYAIDPNSNSGSYTTVSDVVVDVNNDIYISICTNANNTIYLPTGQSIPLSTYPIIGLAPGGTTDVLILKVRQDGSLIKIFGLNRNTYHPSNELWQFNPENSGTYLSKLAAISPKMQLGSCGELYVHGKYFKGGTHTGYVTQLDSATGWQNEFTAFILNGPYGDKNDNGNQSTMNPFTIDQNSNYYLITNGAGIIYIGNDTITTSPGADMLAKYDPTGKVLWYQIFENTELTDILVNNNQNVNFLGTYSIFGDLKSKNLSQMGIPNKGAHDVVVGEYNKNGDLLWANQLGKSDDDISFRFAKNTCDELYITMKSKNIIIGQDSISNNAEQNILAHFSTGTCFQNAPSAEFSFTKNGNTYTFTNKSINSVSYLWDFGDGTTSTSQSPVHTYSSPGPYSISLKATNGTCSDHACMSSLNNIITSNSLKEIKEEISIYPNPNNGIFNILIAPTSTKVFIRIIDMFGRNVYEESYVNSNRNSVKQLNLDKLSKGIYQINLISDQGTFNSTIIIQ